MSPLNRWRASTFGVITTIWAAVLAIYLMVAQFNGGTSALIAKVFGDGWSAATLVILFALVTGFGSWTYWLAAGEHEHPLGSAVGGATVLLVALLIGSQWVTWAWSILWTIPLLVPLLLGAGSTLWLIESRPQPDRAEGGGEENRHLQILE